MKKSGKKPEELTMTNAVSPVRETSRSKLGGTYRVLLNMLMNDGNTAQRCVFVDNANRKDGPRSEKIAVKKHGGVKKTTNLMNK